MERTKYFGDITIQSKGDDDFRSFANVCDSKGKCWELRAYGKTVTEAAQNAWDRYLEDEKFWGDYGYVLHSKGKR